MVDEREPATHQEEPADTSEAAAATAAASGGPQIVGIGASAGGLEALELFLSTLTPDLGLCFVVVQHMDPERKSLLVELLRSRTALPVTQLSAEIKAAPNQIFVAPAGGCVAVRGGVLNPTEESSGAVRRAPIDFFLRSLAQDQGEAAIGVILSGTGTDGSLGLQAIREVGGLTIVQEPNTAKYGGMPRSAISKGLADCVVPPQDIGAKLAELVRQLQQRPEGLPASVQDAEILKKILRLLHRQTGHNFTDYKRNTIVRRIQRRMAVKRVDGFRDYLSHIGEHPDEVATLFKELLIEVTHFFRDHEAFEVLREKAVVPIVAAKRGAEVIRVWIPGCSTGEEAFSIALLFHDEINRTSAACKLQIFATDISADAVATARNGQYGANAAADIPADLLSRFFNKDGDQYTISKDVRDSVIFSIQDLARDPPFSKLDLVSCRNVLIYMGAELQQRVLPIFHYALLPDGFLFLGSSETLGVFQDHFSVLDRRWKLFQRTGHFRLPRPALSGGAVLLDAQVTRSPPDAASVTYRDYVEEVLHEELAPTCLLVNREGRIVYVQGRTGHYLEAVSGEPTHDIVKLARRGLQHEFSAALRRAASQKVEVRCPRLRVKTNSIYELVNLIVRPIIEPTGLRGLFLVILQRQPEPSEVAEGETDGTARSKVEELEAELKSTREYLQTTIEELETANEELKSANEELQSTNEELQSTNEELETSKEELQSLNEELVTVNTELEQKLSELSRANDDMVNLLGSTNVATLFLDNALRIKRFTPATTRLVNLLPSDVGRPIAHFASAIVDERLMQEASAVLESLQNAERAVRSQHGSWYSVRIAPYRTVQNVIDGVVITFLDVTALKQAEAELTKAKKLAEGIVATVREPLVVLDTGLRVVTASRAFHEVFGTEAADLRGEPLAGGGRRHWSDPALTKLLQGVVAGAGPFDDFAVNVDIPGTGPRRFLLNARLVRSPIGDQENAAFTATDDEQILLAIEDVTGRSAIRDGDR